MLKILFTSTDKVICKKIKKITPNTFKLFYGNTESEHDKISEALAGKADVVFLDFHNIHFLRDTLPKAAVIIISDTYDLRKEYLSARFGAKGFITKGIKKHSLRKVFEKIKSGEFWMTRTVTMKVFNEYSLMLRM